MKSYSLELVQRKTGTGLVGKIAVTALVGIGAYYGYKKIKDDDKKTSAVDNLSGTYDLDAQEGEDFTARVLRAARRIIK